MKIALINGSPKMTGSASECILNEIKPLLSESNETIEVHLKSSSIAVGELELIAECQALVIAFPLYVDGIPSHLLSCLYQLEIFFNKQRINPMSVYALINCGFYEGRQNAIAIELMKHWCERSKLYWGQGIGIGGGGMLPALSKIPNGMGPKKNISAALRIVADRVNMNDTADDLYVSPNFPRVAYKLFAEMGWRQQAKANGLKPQVLFVQK